MRRGTNPVLTFELPEAITISALYITFQQNRQTVLEKDLTAVTYDKENGIITLPHPAPCPRWTAPLPLVRKPLLPVVTMCTPLTPLRWTRWRARA